MLGPMVNAERERITGVRGISQQGSRGAEAWWGLGGNWKSPMKPNELHKLPF